MFRLAMTVGSMRVYGEPISESEARAMWETCPMPCWIERMVNGEWVSVS